MLKFKENKLVLMIILVCKGITKRSLFLQTTSRRFYRNKENGVDEMKCVMKKVIIVTTIISFLNIIGCYTHEQLTSDNYNFNENDNIIVLTQDTVYKFSGDSCYVKNDTLFYKVDISADKNIKKIKTVTMPVDQIDKIEVERLDGLKTTLLVVGVLVVAVLAIGAATFDLSDDGKGSLLQ